MQFRTVGAITHCLSGNVQGSFYYYSLVTGYHLHRRQVMPIPISVEVIAQVHAFTTRQKCTEGITFIRRSNLPFNDKATPLLDHNITTTHFHTDSVGVTEINNNDDPGNSHNGDNGAADDNPYFIDATYFPKNDNAAFDNAVENHHADIGGLAPNQEHAASDNMEPPTL